MRAGLLSDPRVVALLQDEFIPCVVSALNTPGLIEDPRDVDLLANYARSSGEPFAGGAREAFLLPDGVMQGVFRSVADQVAGRRDRAHSTMAGRRSPSASTSWFANAERALRAVHGTPPASFVACRDGTSPRVAELARAAATWPSAPPGESALRIHVRNGDTSYDDLHGCSLLDLREAPICNDTPGAPGEEVRMLPSTLRALVRLMVPRGSIAPPIDDASITGDLVLRCERIQGGVAIGSVLGSFAIAPGDRREWGLRANAARPFRVRGEFVGTFSIDLGSGQWRHFRCVTRNERYETFLPWTPPNRPELLAYAAAIEWISSPPTQR